MADSDRSGEHLALYAGSFDPITLGHLDVLRRARRLFDRIILGIGENPEKPALFTPKERVEMARSLIDDMVASDPHRAPVQVEHYSGLTVDFAQHVHASAILRGSARFPSGSSGVICATIPSGGENHPGAPAWLPM